MSNERKSLKKGDATSIIQDVEPELRISEPVNALQRFANMLDAVCGVEARGIERIPEEMREQAMTYCDYVHMFTILCLFGTVSGSVCTCYIFTLRPHSSL
ncbi:hypothetical protein G6011_06715 [Alternaria panax]|uniref:Uncharacterized protein n=1 Tax=Alternaria panax TaxID=48097 RepID=A0AAD4FGY9_9PLEO|nr:hypothetical protein G6011_06715 [Alternaria panax]